MLVHKEGRAVRYVRDSVFGQYSLRRFVSTEAYGVYFGMLLDIVPRLVGAHTVCQARRTIGMRGCHPL